MDILEEEAKNKKNIPWDEFLQRGREIKNFEQNYDFNS